MREKRKRISEVCKLIFGYGIMISLFAGGMILFGYIAALIVGGDIAVLICDVIYKKIVPVMVYLSTGMVLFGLFTMYLAGEMVLTAGKNTGKRR